MCDADADADTLSLSSLCTCRPWPFGTKLHLIPLLTSIMQWGPMGGAEWRRLHGCRSVGGLHEEHPCVVTRPPAKGKGKSKGKGDDQGKGVAALQLGSITLMSQRCQRSCLHRELKPSEAMPLLGKQFPGDTHHSVASRGVIVSLRCLAIMQTCVYLARVPTIPQGIAREAQGQASAHRRTTNLLRMKFPLLPRNVLRIKAKVGKNHHDKGSAEGVNTLKFKSGRNEIHKG